MENSFNNRDFEKFVKQNADQYRMFPTEKVWKSIHSALHTRSRWYGIGLALLLLSTTVVTWVMLTPGGKSENIASVTNSSAIKKESAIKTPVPAITIINTVKSSRNRPSPITSPTSLQEDLLGLSLPASGLDISGNETADIVQSNIKPVIESPASLQPGSIAKSILFQAKPGIDKKQTEPDRLISAGIKQKDPYLIAGNNLNRPAGAPTEEPSVKKDIYPPFTIESVVNSYTHRPQKNKLQWMLYVTPTISYRELGENEEFIARSRYNSIVSPGSANPYDYNFDVNSVVNHKPDMGLQLGVRAAYPLSKWFSFTGGLQFNVSKYDIKAYNHDPEMATIALSTAGGGTNTISAVSRYRNTGSNKENWLQNFYFSASVPLGMELKLSDGLKNYFGIAGTLQPTYILDNRSYLISTDYKNYAQVPSLTRHWNLSTSFEIFAATHIRGMQLRLGPQVRYQVMSSFVKDYPIKEHLIDFGLKLGVMLR